MTMIAEGAEAKRVEEAMDKRKRKIEDDKKWEGLSPFPIYAACSNPSSLITHLLLLDTREDRVSDWRSFNKGTGKKKKPKIQVLG